MFVSDKKWELIRKYFSEEEKSVLRAAVNGETVCPPGFYLDEVNIAPALLEKLKLAVHGARITGHESRG